MDNLDNLNKQQLERLISVVSHTSFSICNSDNVALSMVDLDYSFEHFGFKNQVDRRLLATDPTSYMADFIAPVLNPIISHYEARFGKLA